MLVTPGSQMVKEMHVRQMVLVHVAHAKYYHHIALSLEFSRIHNS